MPILRFPAPLRNFWTRVDQFHERRPMFTAILWAGNKGILASVLADTVLNQLAKRKWKAEINEELLYVEEEQKESFKDNFSDISKENINLENASNSSGVSGIGTGGGLLSGTTGGKDGSNAVNTMPQTPFTGKNVDERTRDIIIQAGLDPAPPPLKVDGNKAIAFGIWNGLFCGGFLKFLYSDVFAKFFPLTLTTSTSTTTAVGTKVPNSTVTKVITTTIRHPRYWIHVFSMVAFCNFISTPMFVTPNYYLIKSALEALGSPEFRIAMEEKAITGKTTLDLVKEEFHFIFSRAKYRYSREWLDVLYVTWCFWIPINFLTFSVVPTHWRVPFCAFCSVFAQAAQSMNASRLEALREDEDDQMFRRRKSARPKTGAATTSEDIDLPSGSKKSDDQSTDTSRSLTNLGGESSTASELSRTFIGSSSSDENKYNFGYTNRYHDLASGHNVELSRDVSRVINLMVYGPGISNTDTYGVEEQGAFRHTISNRKKARRASENRGDGSLTMPNLDRNVAESGEGRDNGSTLNLLPSPRSPMGNMSFGGGGDSSPVSSRAGSKEYSGAVQFNTNRERNMPAEGGDRHTTPGDSTPTNRRFGSFGFLPTTHVDNTSRDPDIRGYGSPDNYNKWRKFNYEQLHGQQGQNNQGTGQNGGATPKNYQRTGSNTDTPKAPRNKDSTGQPHFYTQSGDNHASINLGNRGSGYGTRVSDSVIYEGGRNSSYDPDIKGYGSPEEYGKWRRFHYEKLKEEQRWTI